MKYLMHFIVLACFGCTLQNKNQIANLDIKPSISSIAKTHFKKIKELDSSKSPIQLYLNKAYAQVYINDSLVNIPQNRILNHPFKSFYYWAGDTLKIDGAFGMFTGVGFTIRIYKNNAVLYHMQSSDDWPDFSFTKTGKLLNRIEVPCSKTKIILSQVPDTLHNQLIFGYVEFESKDYFVSGASEQSDHLTYNRTKVRVNMKVYFKSARFNAPITD